MVETKSFLTPIEPNLLPPKHTMIKPQCFICKHFPVCNIREDYLKTAQLIQEILGAPCDSYELQPTPVPISDFGGTVVKNSEEYFPETLISNGGKTGTYYLAKYETPSLIKFVYNFEGYFVKFTATYNEETGEFDIPAGIEICYGIECTIAEDLDTLQLGLLSLKEDLELAEDTEQEEGDVINTTYFSANLNCQFYEWEKGLDYHAGVQRIIARYPHGVPLGKEGELYHLATFHKEDHCVPCYHPENGHPAFAPMPFPVYIPPKCERKRPPTRDELNEF